MKRIFPVFALALLLIILVFPVSATENAASDMRTIYIHWGDARTFEFRIQDGWSWGDLCVDDVYNHNWFDVQSQSYGTVWLISDDRTQAFRIKDSSGTYMAITNEITEDHYYADLPDMYFDLLIQNTSGLYDSHRLYGTWFNASFKKLISEDITFNSDTLGVCKFVYLLEGKVIGLRVGIQNDGAYTKDYLLGEYGINHSGDPVFALDQVLSDHSRFLALEPCVAGSHPYDEFVTAVAATCTETGLATRKCFLCDSVDTEIIPVRAFHDYSGWTITDPSCTDEGIKIRTCKLCGYEDKNVLPALGHDFPVVGACRREGCDEYPGKNIVDGAGNLWNGVTGWVGGLFDGESSDGESSDGESSDGKSWWEGTFTQDPTGNDFIDGVNAIIKLVALALPILLFFFLWPILKPVLAFLGDVFRAGFKAASSGLKSFAKWVKRKAKRKKTK